MKNFYLASLLSTIIISLSAIDQQRNYTDIHQALFVKDCEISNQSGKNFLIGNMRYTISNNSGTLHHVIYIKNLSGVHVVAGTAIGDNFQSTIMRSFDIQQLSVYQDKSQHIKIIAAVNTQKKASSGFASLTFDTHLHCKTETWTDQIDYH